MIVANDVPTTILHLDHVTKSYEPNLPPAVSGMTLTLRQGELLGLLGPSGCGKTTLLRLIAGFEQPQSGHIKLAGHHASGACGWIPPERRGIGMVFQDYALFPHLTLAQNVAFGLRRLAHLTPSEVDKRTQEAIGLVGLEGLAQRYPHQLSGGQQQRVAIARALAPDPVLVLLDEPLSNLDVQVRQHLRQELRDILKTTGTAAVFVTHDQEEALAIADQVAVMRDGCLEQWGPPEIIYQHPASRFVADFVTHANFLPAQHQHPGWETAIGYFELPPQAILNANNGNGANRGELMIRQEALELVPDDQGPVMIRDRQFLGREYRYYLQTLDNHTLLARTSADCALAIGQSVRVIVNPGTLRLFPTPTSHKQGNNGKLMPQQMNGGMMRACQEISKLPPRHWFRSKG